MYASVNPLGPDNGRDFTTGFAEDGQGQVGCYAAMPGCLLRTKCKSMKGDIMSKWVRLLGVAATLTLTASEVAQAGTCTVSFKGNTCSVETATAAQCCSVETVIPCGNFTFHGGHYWDGL